VIGDTCMLLCGLFALHFAQQTVGAKPAPGLPCALFAWGDGESKARAKRAARTRRCVCDFRREWEKATLPLAPSLRGALATKQSRLSPRRNSGLLRCARN